jgi:hypothetical protein
MGRRRAGVGVVRWQQRQASDDQGNSAEHPRREEKVWVAVDPHDCHWTVALHDDEATWNLTRTTAWGEFLEGLVGFRSAEAAIAKANARAAEMT